MTVCFGFEDCVDSAIDSLMQLPTVLTVPRQTYENEINNIKAMLKVLLSSTVSNSRLNNLLQHSNKILNRLKVLEEYSLHCSAKPKFLNSKIQESINVKVGDVIDINSDSVQSVLPVRYYWKQHDILMDGENMKTLKIVIISRKYIFKWYFSLCLSTSLLPFRSRRSSVHNSR